MYISGGLTSFLTGITEPIEYTFLFVAPWLYVIHAFLDGCSFYVADIMNIRIGNSFSGGLIDYLLFGVLQGKDKTNWPNVLIMGVIWFFLYFFVFTFCIKKFHVNIPGMQVTDDKEADTIMNEGPKTGNKLYNESMDIITALGGQNNIQTVSACATRLRVSLKDNSKVNEGVFKKLGAPGVLKVGGGIQAILGGKADIYSQEINDILAHPDAVPKAKVEAKEVSAATAEKSEKHHVKKTIDLAAPVNGEFEDLSQVKDEVFSKKMMGEGFAIKPVDGNIYSPVTGVISSIFKTKHAIGITTIDGLEVLLHLGLDTVELEGKPFTILVKEEQKVTPDTQLAKMDLNQIKDAGKMSDILTIITNSNDYVAKAKNLVQTGEQIKAHADIFKIETK